MKAAWPGATASVPFEIPNKFVAAMPAHVVERADLTIAGAKYQDRGARGMDFAHDVIAGGRNFINRADIQPAAFEDAIAFPFESLSRNHGFDRNGAGTDLRKGFPPAATEVGR